MALKRLLMTLALTGCFPSADPGDFSLCEVGGTACPSGSFCSERGLCEPIPVTLRTGVTVSGQVSQSLPGGGQQPLPGAFVAVEGAGLWAMADGSGNYTLRQVPPGSYMLTVHPGTGSQEPLDRPSLGQLAIELDALDEGRSVVRDLAVSSRGDLLGRVVLRDRNRFDPVHGGVQLMVEGLPGHEELSDPDGRFLITGIPEGSHRLQVHLPGYGAQTHEVAIVGAQRQVLGTVNPDPEDHEWVAGAINMAAEGEAAGWTLTGQVVAPEGQGLDGLEIILSPLFAGSVEAIPFDAEGRFQIQRPAGGVYNLFARGPGWRAGRLSQVRGDPGTEVEVTILPLRIGGGAAPDLDEDGVPDAEDDDRDGDGCANAADAFPDDPLGCVDLDQDGLADPTDNDDDDDGVDDLEETRLGSDGFATNPRQANQTTGGRIQGGDASEGSLDGSFRLVNAGLGTEMVPAAVQRPLYGDARTAQLLLQAQELILPANESAEVEVELSGLPPAAGSEFGLFATEQPCPDGLCQGQIEVLACQTDGWRGENRCTGRMTFPATAGEQRWRVWVRPTQRSNQPSPDTLMGPEEAPEAHDCLGVDATYPVYGFIHRRVASSRGDFAIRPPGAELAAPYLPACFTGANRFQDTCTPWHLRDEDGDDLVMTSFSITPAESAFQRCYQLSGLESGNPQVYFPGHAILCHPLTLRATFSDGLGGEEIDFQMRLTPLGAGSSFGTFGECWN